MYATLRCMDDYRDVNRPAGTSALPRTPPRRTTRCRGSSTIPSFLSEVVRFDLPRLGDIARPRRGAPAVPHRHRHGVAGAARRADDRARLLARRDRRRPAGSPQRPACRGRRSSRPSSTTRRRGARAGARSTSSTPASARSCWLPDIRRWARGRRRRCCGRAAGCFIREGHPVLWALDDARRRRLAGARVPLLRAGRADASGTRTAPTSRPTWSSRTT